MDSSCKYFEWTVMDSQKEISNYVDWEITSWSWKTMGRSGGLAYLSGMAKKHYIQASLSPGYNLIHCTYHMQNRYAYHQSEACHLHCKTGLH
jgi:hypothetical protein